MRAKFPQENGKRPYRHFLVLVGPVVVKVVRECGGRRAGGHGLVQGRPTAATGFGAVVLGRVDGWKK